ncbi:hypothetical protein AX16_007417 [Volvariella volvacea WC 439]|nr:hypothetical protein AX16_007417 [Volvariella volvacea WC 439]
MTIYSCCPKLCEDLIRQGRPVSEWNYIELAVYNICVIHQDAQTFFNHHTSDPLPPPKVIHPEFLSALHAKEAEDERMKELFQKMDGAADEGSVENVVGFAGVLLDAFGYTRGGVKDAAKSWKTMKAQKEVPFVSAGKNRTATLDACLVRKGREETSDEEGDIALVVEVDREAVPPSTGGDYEARLVGSAIAAFASNLAKRKSTGIGKHSESAPATLAVPTEPTSTSEPASRGHHATSNVSVDSPDVAVMPAILFKGTLPTFYKVHTTQELLDAVTEGRHPTNKTYVYAHTPNIPEYSYALLKKSMRPLGNRPVIASCFEAFMDYVD